MTHSENDMRRITSRFAVVWDFVYILNFVEQYINGWCDRDNSTIYLISATKAVFACSAMISVDLYQRKKNNVSNKQYRSGISTRSPCGYPGLNSQVYRTTSKS